MPAPTTVIRSLGLWRTIDGDTHNFNYRTDYFSDETLAKAWKDAGNTTEWGVPKTWQQVQAVTLRQAKGVASRHP